MIDLNVFWGVAILLVRILILNLLLWTYFISLLLCNLKTSNCSYMFFHISVGMCVSYKIWHVCCGFVLNLGMVCCQFSLVWEDF